VATINPNYSRLEAGYLFPEIGRRTSAFQAENPGVEVMRLGIGNTTEPLSAAVLAGLRDGVALLGTADTYTGYGDEQGEEELRLALVKRYAAYGADLDADEFFISDGAKPDAANIQSIFAVDNVVAVQDPAYPVYVDTNVIAGRAGESRHGRYDRLVYMPCTEENDFFPDVPDGKVDLIYICNPNNPTGATATREELAAFVEYAIAHKAVIIYDSAYAAYISNPRLPRSIYQIEGAKRCAIEINSLSKEAGFTGVRLGWTIVPRALECDDAAPGELNRLWFRRQTTMFNGASNIIQKGAIAALSEQGQRECATMVAYYMRNARVIHEGIDSVGLTCYGGVDAPYVWLLTPGGMTSWDFFDKLLKEAHVVGTPGSGFGPSGEGYFRLSAFGHDRDIKRAVASIRDNLTL